jgi:putative flippase GtrA
MSGFGGLRRYRASVGQFVRFGLVGGSGVVVNFGVYYLAAKFSPPIWPSATSPKTGVWWDLPVTTFNIRWYHVFSFLAFIVANIWNYELNRHWTFRAVMQSAQRPSGWRSFRRFFLVGLLAQLVGMALETLLLHANSPLQLSPRIFDESSGLRNPAYWAHFIMICVTIPVSFVLNKFWSFKGRASLAGEP